MKFFLSLVAAYFAIQVSAHCKNLQSKTPIVAASIHPIYHIVLAITQDKENTRLIISPTSSHHAHHLKKNDVKSLIEADVIFYVSDILEHKFPKLIDSYHKENQSFELAKSKGITVLQGRGNNNNIDPHIWLNPDNGIKIAQLITDKLSTINPALSETYYHNLAIFIQEVKASDKIMKASLAKAKGDYLFYHDGYQYFEEYFNIKPLKVVSYNHDSELTLKDMSEIDRLTKENHVKCMFATLQDERNSAMQLAKNYNMRFATLDLIGEKNMVFPSDTNGYSFILLNMVNSITGCLNQ